MLQIRPNCELCDKDLPADALNARICTYECTFCAECVEVKLHNVCPNCGGGFAQRPVRPAQAHREGVGLVHQPASDKRVLTKYSIDEITTFADGLKTIPPEQR